MTIEDSWGGMNILLDIEFDRYIKKLKLKLCVMRSLIFYFKQF